MGIHIWTIRAGWEPLHCQAKENLMKTVQVCPFKCTISTSL